MLSGSICALLDLDPLIAVMAAFKRLNRILHLIQVITFEYGCFFASAIRLARLVYHMSTRKQARSILHLLRKNDDGISAGKSEDHLAKSR